MALNSRFPNRIELILIKGEVLQKTSRRLCRADFHGFIIIRGIEDVSTIRVIFEKMFIQHGGMSDVLHHRDETRVSEKTGLNTPQSWFEWIQYMLKAKSKYSGQWAH